MMPPKKSKAARKGKPDDDEVNVLKETAAMLDSSEEHGPSHEEGDSEERGTPDEGVENEKGKKSSPEKKAHFSMFEITTIDGKRKRQVPALEQMLHEWIDNHCEGRDEMRLSITEVYNCYLEMCVSNSSVGVPQTNFGKTIRNQFPKGFGFRKASPYFGMVKEKKIRKKVPKVKADTLNLKMRDIIERSLEDLENPTSGIRFNKLLTYIAGKYPALRIELRPKMLLNGLQRGLRFGHIICERGIGRCGFYRKYLTDEEQAEEEKKDKKKTSDKGDESTEEGEEGDKKKEEEDGKEDTNEDDDDDGEKGSKRKAEATERRVKRRKAAAAKRKKAEQKMRFIQHGDPKRLEDTFYLGMTFMSEPKEASVNRIKKYIQENYQDVNVDSRLKRCLEVGKERGYWEQMTGSGTGSGTFRLLVDEFDPSDDDDLIGMVVNAIMAGTEPKMCSANLLKKYVMEWFSEKFKLVDRPHLFKKALERAVANNEIRQLSGIGASGTFQLAKPFYPSPLILAGQDTSSDYEVEESDETPQVPYEFGNYGNAYKPRPSKRRGMARVKAVSAKPAIEIAQTTTSRKKRGSAKKRRKVSSKEESESSSEESSSEEESSSSEEEVEEPPPKPRGRQPPKRGQKAAKPAPKRAAPAKRKAPPAKKEKPAEKNARKRPSYKEESSEDEEPENSRTPTRSSGRRSAQQSPRSTGKGRARPSYQEDSGNEVEEEEVQKTPSRRKSQGGGKQKTPASSRSRGRRTSYTEETDEEEEEKPTTPRTPAAKKQGTAKSPSKSKSRKVAESDSDISEPEKQGTAKSPRKSKSRKVAESDSDISEPEKQGTAKSPSKSKSRKVAESDSDISEPEKAAPTPSRSRSRGQSAERADSEEEDSADDRRKPFSKSRGHSRASRTPGRGSRHVADSSDDDSDMDDAPPKVPAKLPKTPAAKKQGSSPAPTKGRSRKK